MFKDVNIIFEEPKPETDTQQQPIIEEGSSVVEVDDVKEVATGDSISDIYEGTLYKSDALTPTETWNRKGVTESKPLLQIMGEETLRLSQLPARVFSGDVFGYLNYLSVVMISPKSVAVTHLYQSKVIPEGFDHSYCSTMEAAIKLLSLNKSEKEMESFFREIENQS